MLAAQFGYFIYYVVRDLRRTEETPVTESIPAKTEIPENGSQEAIPVRKHVTKSSSSPEAQTTVQTEARTEVPAAPKEPYRYDGWKWDMVELNSADSAALDALPGIGPYYAKQILRYRERLFGRFHDIHQLMEIRGIDTTLFAKIEDRIFIASETVIIYDLYTISSDSLASHPYIGAYMARGIDRYRRMTDRERFSIQALVDNRIATETQARRIALYFR